MDSWSTKHESMKMVISLMVAVMTIAAHCDVADSDSRGANSERSSRFLLFGGIVQTDQPIVLSEEESRESEAWSSYAKAVWCLDENSERDGLREYRNHLDDALSQMPESDWLFNQWEKGWKQERNSAVRLASLAKIWSNLHESDRRLTDCYMDLLEAMNRRSEAAEIGRRYLEATGWQDCEMMFRYVDDVYIGNRQPPVETNLRKALSVHAKKDSCGAVHAAVAAYWGRVWLYEKAHLPEGVSEKRHQTRVERYRRICMKHAALAECNVSTLPSRTQYGLAQVYHKAEAWSDLLQYLDGLSGESSVTGLTWYFMERSNALLQLGRKAELAEWLSQIQNDRPWHEAILVRACELYEQELKDSSRALELCRQLVSQRPSNLQYRIHAAQLCLQEGRSMEGLSFLSSVAGLNPMATFLRGRLLEQHGEFEQAYSEFKILNQAMKRVQQTSGLRVAVYAELTSICQKLGKEEEALAFAKKVYEQNPSIATGCNLYGYLLAVYGKELPLAEKLIQQALESEPDNAAFLDSLAWVYYRQGCYEKAMEAMIQVVRLGGLNEDVTGEGTEHLGRICEALGYGELGAFYLEESLRVRKLNGMK